MNIAFIKMTCVYLFKVKKIAIISLLVLQVFLVLGIGNSLFLAHKWHLKSIKKQVKRQIKEHVSSNELCYFTFSMSGSEFNNLKWEHNKEFELDGQMYDIVEGDTCNEIVYYSCFKDDKETLAKYAFQKKWQFAYQQNKKSTDQMVLQISLWQALHFCKVQNFTIYDKLLAKDHPFNLIFQQQIHQTITPPPPEFLS